MKRLIYFAVTVLMSIYLVQATLKCESMPSTPIRGQSATSTKDARGVGQTVPRTFHKSIARWLWLKLSHARRMNATVLVPRPKPTTYSID